MTAPGDIRPDPTPMPPRLRWIGLASLVAGLLVLVPAATADPTRFLANWLVLFLWILTLGLGALFLVALEYLVNARWSVPFRRISELLSGLLPWSLVLLAPVLLGMGHLYEWTHPEAVSADPILARKTPYLNVPFFLIRLALYYLVWLAFYRLFTGGSIRSDADRPDRHGRRAVRLAPVFMILYAFTVTFAAVDLVMSLTPHWYSTIFGPYLMISAVVGGIALTTLACVLLKQHGKLPEAIGPDHFYNLGGMLFAMNTLRTYLAYSQFLLIWYGNIPSEVAWYAARQKEGWLYVSLGMIVVYFAVPFLALVSRAAKMNLRRLRWVSIWVLAAYAIDLYWLVLPSVPHLHGGPFSWMDLGFPLVAAGIVILVWFQRASRAPLLPVGDPRLESGLTFHL